MIFPATYAPPAISTTRIGSQTGGRIVSVRSSGERAMCRRRNMTKYTATTHFRTITAMPTAPYSCPIRSVSNFAEHAYRWTESFLAEYSLYALEDGRDPRIVAGACRYRRFAGANFPLTDSRVPDFSYRTHTRAWQ